MPTPNLMELLDAGVHFGHKKAKSHPKAKEYIFTLREGIYVIDLDQTLKRLQEATAFLKKQMELGKTILFVGTKRQAKEIIKRVAENTSMPYVNKRFLGGTLTNFETIRKNIMQLESLENQINNPNFDTLTKKEKKIITDKKDRLLATFEGVRAMKQLPDVLFVIDAKKEDLAIREAIRMEIPVVAITDTDCDPQKINYPIPANDDAPRAIEIIMKQIEEAMVGEKKIKKDTEEKSEIRISKSETNSKSEIIKIQKEKKTKISSKTKTKKEK